MKLAGKRLRYGPTSVAQGSLLFFLVGFDCPTPTFRSSFVRVAGFRVTKSNHAEASSVVISSYIYYYSKLYPIWQRKKSIVLFPFPTYEDGKQQEEEKQR